ncbi:hypothetical protein IWW50_003386 [Coemansia erecta]|nr:hypothetical protein GGF43_002066 [Coemansia sp. RSA 2618]KAJ2824319.1 hypothetical protein IWW50_003386 [Coemansia erecta]
MSSHRDNKAAAPQPIPAAGDRRRNSFAGWSQSFFGLSGRTAGPAGASPPANFPPANYPLHTARTFSGPGPAAPDSATASSLPGMGMFRRFSASQVPAQPQPQPQHPAAAQGLSEAVGAHWPDAPKPDMYHPAASTPNAHWPSGSRLPKALEEVREADDRPPSRPDSRMRNLMLSGQFLI